MRTIFHRGEGSFTIQRREDDVEPLLELNKALQNTPQRSESFHHIASIPNIVIEQWLIESGLSYGSPEFTLFMRRKLKDRDWLFLKTTDKRL